MTGDPGLDAMIVRHPRQHPNCGQPALSRPRNGSRSATLTHQFSLAVQKECGSTRYGYLIERCYGARYDPSHPDDAENHIEAGGLQRCVKVVQTNVHLAAGDSGAGRRQGRHREGH